MFTGAAGKYYLDAIDIWVAFKMFVSNGSDDLLRYPKKKDSITHDWMDSNGIDVDLSRIFFEPRTVNLEIKAVASSEEEFWRSYTQFIAQWAKPWAHRLEIAEFSRSFFVYYKDCTNVERLTRIKRTNLIGWQFTLIVEEPEPVIDNTDTYILAEEGLFLIT